MVIELIEAIALKRDFPHLDWNTFSKESKRTTQYNCIAFAVGDEAQPWWPKKDGHHWPSEDKGVPQQETVEAFIAAFGTKDYVVCGHGNVEHGKEKIALYADPKTRRPKHAARQLPNGRWKSKLGGGIDIEHSSLDELNCDLHGTVVCFLERDVGILSL